MKRKRIALLLALCLAASLLPLSAAAETPVPTAPGLYLQVGYAYTDVENVFWTEEYCDRLEMAAGEEWFRFTLVDAAGRAAVVPKEKLRITGVEAEISDLTAPFTAGADMGFFVITFKSEGTGAGHGPARRDAGVSGLAGGELPPPRRGVFPLPADDPQRPR